MVDFSQYEERYGLPSGYLARTMQIESGGNVNAKNPNSSAKGPFQFIDSTAKAYGLNDPFDLEQSTDAAARLARDNANILRNALGREPTGAELYLAHQQGAGGAKKLLVNADKPAVDVVGADAVRLNAGDSSMLASDFANLWLNKFNKTQAPVSQATPEARRVQYGLGDRDPGTAAQVLQAVAAGDMTKSEAARYVSEDLLDGIEGGSAYDILNKEEKEASLLDRLGDAAQYLNLAGVGQPADPLPAPRMSNGIYPGRQGVGSKALSRLGIASLV